MLLFKCSEPTYYDVLKSHSCRRDANWLAYLETKYGIELFQFHAV